MKQLHPREAHGSRPFQDRRPSKSAQRASRTRKWRKAQTVATFGNNKRLEPKAAAVSHFSCSKQVPGMDLLHPLVYTPYMAYHSFKCPDSPSEASQQVTSTPCHRKKPLPLELHTLLGWPLEPPKKYGDVESFCNQLEGKHVNIPEAKPA